MDDNCEIGIFVGCLKAVLHDPKESYDEQRNFFVLHCINFSKVVKSMLNLRRNETYVITLLEGLKYLREGKECLDKRLENIKLENDHEISE